jgi:hypothetical protein
VRIDELHRRIHRAPNLLRADRANRFVNRHDAPHFRRIDFVAVQQFDLRINHFQARRPQPVDFRLAVKNQKLPGLQSPFEIAAVKKLASQQSARLVLDQQMINSVAAETPASNGLPAHHPRANGVGSVWLNVFDLREVHAVFVAKRQVAEQISERADAALGEQFGALRAHPLDHAHFATEAHGHGLLFISLRPCRCGKRETCVVPPRTDTVSDSCLRKVHPSTGNGGSSGW